MLSYHVVINPLTSWKGSLYDRDLSPMKANTWVMSLKHQCGIKSLHRYGGVGENLCRISLLQKLQMSFLRESFVVKKHIPTYFKKPPKLSLMSKCLFDFVRITSVKTPLEATIDPRTTNSVSQVQERGIQKCPSCGGTDNFRRSSKKCLPCVPRASVDKEGDCCC